MGGSDVTTTCAVYKHPKRTANGGRTGSPSTPSHASPPSIAELNPALRQKTLDSIRIHDLAAELKLELVPKADKFSIHLQSETGQNFARIAFANKSGKRELRVNDITAPLPGAVGSPIRLRLFLDGSVVEVFANETTSLTARIYQIPSGPLRLKIDGDAELTNLDVWQMKPISKDRLTGSLCTIVPERG